MRVPGLSFKYLYQYMIEHIDTVLEEWKQFINDRLIPVISETGAPLEGNYYSYHLTNTYCGSYRRKQINLIQCVNEQSVKKILEIGFNAGFSALLCLLSNPTVSITCVDIGVHSYVVPCFNTLKSVFGDRIELIIGNSNTVLPNINGSFDIIHIDGSHDPILARNDIINTKRLAADEAYLIMDDVDHPPLTDLWNNYCALYKLQDCGYSGANHSIKKFKRDTTLVFYTCYFGPGDMSSPREHNHIAMGIPPLPSNVYDCYYFTNNPSVRDYIKNTGWITIFCDTVPIKDTDILNAFDTKELKSCPHHFPCLNKYSYLCYCDSKYAVNENRVKEHLSLLTGNCLMILPTHPDFGPNVWSEFQACLLQPRYALNKDHYMNYINTQLAAGFPSETKFHYTTQFMIRKNNRLTQLIGEKWYEHIKMCGIQCQISFFFVHQLFESYIYNINTYDGYYWA